jgi:hypothetical protein
MGCIDSQSHLVDHMTYVDKLLYFLWVPKRVMDHRNVLYSIKTLYLTEHAALAYIYGILENEWPLKNNHYYLLFK